MTMPGVVYAVVDGRQGKIAAWYIVHSHNVRKIPIPDGHALVEIERKPHAGETHVDLATGRLIQEQVT